MVRSSLLPYAFILAPHLYGKNVENFKQLLLWSQCCSNVMWSLLGIGEQMIAKNGHRPFTKMAAMPIYGKKLQNSSSPESDKPWGLIFAQIIVDRRSTKIAKMMGPRWCLTFLWQSCICFPQAFVWDLYIISEEMLRIHNLCFTSEDYDPVELKLDEEHRSA